MGVTTDQVLGKQDVESPAVSLGIKMLEQIITYRTLLDGDESRVFSLDSRTRKYDRLSYSEEFMAFMHCLYATRFLIMYDWMPRQIWGERFLNDRERLERADLLTLRLLLTAAARNDHFCDGYLGSLYTGGQLPTIMARLVEIHRELASGRHGWRQVTCGPLPDERTGHLFEYHNFDTMYWVDPGRFLAGGYPGDLDPAKAREKIRFLIKSGIRQVVNLMEKDEVNGTGEPFRPYAADLHELARQAGSDIKICTIEIKDVTAPSKLQMKYILDTVDQALEEDRPVYVHCWGGRGRTGTAAGCYLVRHDLVEAEEALNYLKSIRKDIVKGDKPSPETSQQRSMVRNWKVGE